MHEPSSVCTLLLVVLTSLVSCLGFRSRQIEEMYIFNPESILARKEYYRLVTPAFLHADWGHLLCNMVSLFLFGSLIEPFLGKAQFLLIYFAAVAGGNLLALYVHRHHEYRAYGASGGVCGVIFTYVLIFPRGGISLFPVPIGIFVPAWLYAVGFMALSFYGMKHSNKGNVGHDAHLGGAIVGLLIAGALNPRLARDHWQIFGLVLAASVLLLIYLRLNPLFLPLAGFSNRADRQSPRPAYARERLEVDAILEKIARRGIDSLSENEKTRLNETSAKYRRREEPKKPESGLAV